MGRDLTSPPDPLIVVDPLSSAKLSEQMPLEYAAHWTGELESGMAQHLDTMDMVRAREAYSRWLGSERTSNPDRRIWEEILNRNPNVGIVKGEETLWGRDAADFLANNSDNITLGGNGISFRPQNAAQQNPPTDCQRFVGLVGGIASRHNNAEGFMDEMARTFTAANDSTIDEMRRTANTGIPQGRQNFGPANAANAGFKVKFRDGSNQVRHFVGGLVAGYRLGHAPALLLMNSREEPNSFRCQRCRHRS